MSCGDSKLDDEFLKETEEILQKLSVIGAKLIKIPREREIQCLMYAEIKSNEEFLVKPRFIPSEISIELSLMKLLTELRDDLFCYLQNYASHRDTRHIKSILSLNSNNKKSKKSICYLIEKNVWATDAVYGDYYVVYHPSEQKYSIYNKRRGRKRRIIAERKKFNSIEDLKQFINEDAVIQIESEFDRLLNLVIQEINLVKAEYNIIRSKFGEFNPKGSLKEILITGERLIYPQTLLSVFSIGYVAEMYLKKVFSENNIKYTKKIRFDLEKGFNLSLFSHKTKKILHKILDEYNDTKHNPNHRINRENLRKLYNKLKKNMKLE